jgi:integrase
MRDYSFFLAPLMRDFVTFREISGRWNNFYEVMLVRFGKYCEKQYPDAYELTQEMVDSWCSRRKTESNNACITRIYSVVGFIRYLRKRGKTNVTEPSIPRKEPNTHIPHAFTETELKNFFNACDTIPDWPKTKEQLSRRITVPVFFRLLYSSGIRTNEARLLRRKDVDLLNGVLNVQYSKGSAQHYVALHDSMTSLLRQYDAAINRQYPDRIYFFPTKNGSFHANNWVCNNFRRMWAQCSESRATAYELRHNYAIENINRWTGEGFGFHKKLLYLSRSMGHSVLESTKYYYSLVPGLADILEVQTDSDMIPEVSDDESI